MKNLIIHQIFILNKLYAIEEKTQWRTIISMQREKKVFSMMFYGISIERPHLQNILQDCLSKLNTAIVFTE